MFCPVCRAEYREGFSLCADCQTQLVPLLPEKNCGPAVSLIWEGEDPVLHDRLIEQLKEKQIFYVDTPLDAYRRGRVDLWNIEPAPKFGFTISVRDADRAEAVRILEKLLDIEPSDDPVLNPLAQTSGRNGPEAAAVESWDESTPSRVIWSGRDLKELEFLEASLDGVGISISRSAESDRDAPISLLVSESEEAAAKEILKQIGENAVPPQPAPDPPESVWHDPPVRSYALLWLLVCIWLIAGITVLLTPPDSTFGIACKALAEIASFADGVGFFWMIYQAVRYEYRPLRFVLIALFLPFSFIWYYFERYSSRPPSNRFPISLRSRMQRPSR
jgi:hypothetical protein